MLHFEKRKHTPSAWLTNKAAASLPWCHSASDGFQPSPFPFSFSSLSTAQHTNTLLHLFPFRRNYPPASGKKEKEPISHIFDVSTQTSQVTEYFPIYRTNTLVPIVVSYRGPIAPILYRSGHTLRQLINAEAVSLPIGHVAG